MALMPVYYKSFAFVRGEPWVTLFAVAVTYEVVTLSVKSHSNRELTRRFLRLGIWLGLAALSRQWGFLLWAAVALFLPAWWWRGRRAGAGGVLEEKGTQPEARRDEIVLRAAVLGVLVAGDKPGEMAARLGRANRAAFGVTILLLGGLAYGALFFWRWLKDARAGHVTLAYAFIWLVAMVSIAGYLAFVIIVPGAGSGDTIKATYLLHIYPLMALLSGELMEAIRRRTPWGYNSVWLVIFVTGIILLPLLRTHYLP